MNKDNKKNENAVALANLRYKIIKKRLKKLVNGKSLAAVNLGKLGGLATAAKLSPEERRINAINAVNARWRKYHVE
jgi:hypothetical protein